MLVVYTSADCEVSHVKGNWHHSVESSRQEGSHYAGMKQQRIGQCEVDVQLMGQDKLLSLDDHLLVFAPLRKADDPVSHQADDQRQLLTLAAEQTEEEREHPVVAGEEPFAGTLKQLIYESRITDDLANLLHSL